MLANISRRPVRLFQFSVFAKKKPSPAGTGGGLVIQGGARDGPARYFLTSSAVSFVSSLALMLTSFTCLPRVSCQISTL